MMASRKRWLDAGRSRGRNFDDFFSDYKAAKCHSRRVHRQASETFMKNQLDEIDRTCRIGSTIVLASR